MNSNEISRALRRDRSTRDKFVGVFAADELPPEKESPGGYIVNTDPSTKAGQHWVAFYCNDGCLECFDSFGANPGKYSPYIAEWINDGGFKIKQKEVLQSKDSTVCGQYCMLFLLCRCRNISYENFMSMFSGNQHVNDKLVCKIVNKFFHLATTVQDQDFLLSMLFKK